jgi:hypothetical protein
MVYINNYVDLKWCVFELHESIYIYICIPFTYEQNVS